MTQDGFNTFCASLPHSFHVVQWHGADVWKVGRPAQRNDDGIGKKTGSQPFKMFCAGWWNDEQEPARVTFHCSDIGFEMLKDTPGCRPAPYMASRGMTWIQRFNDEGVSDAALKDYIESSHRLMAAKLTKTLQRELGFIA